MQQLLKKIHRERKDSLRRSAVLQNQLQLQMACGLTGITERTKSLTVLTQKMAEKYFGNWKDVVGKFLRLDNTVTVEVVEHAENTKLNSITGCRSLVLLKQLKKRWTLFYSTDWGPQPAIFHIHADAG